MHMIVPEYPSAVFGAFFWLAGSADGQAFSRELLSIGVDTSDVVALLLTLHAKGASEKRQWEVEGRYGFHTGCNGPGVVSILIQDMDCCSA